jgi:adenylate kinase family enzyme
MVIYGPSGCGKSTHSAALAKFFGKTRVVDEWEPGGNVADDTLALTNHPHQGAMDFYTATAIAGINLTPATVGKRITRSHAKCIECQQPLGHSHLAYCLLIPFVMGEAA